MHARMHEFSTRRGLLRLPPIISPTFSSVQKIFVSAIVVPRVTRDLTVSPISFNSKWSHLSDTELADPVFGLPGRVELVLGINIF